jgi:hypothetical protein
MTMLLNRGSSGCLDPDVLLLPSHKAFGFVWNLVIPTRELLPTLHLRFPGIVV